MSDYILARLKGIYQVLDGTRPLPRRGVLRLLGHGFRVEDGGDATELTFPAGLQADAVGGGRTTGAEGPLLLGRLEVPASTALRVQIDVLGQSATNATVAYSTTHHVSARRNGSAAAQVGGSDLVSDDISGALSGVVVAFQGSGAYLQVFVTGVAGQTVDWNMRMRVLSGPYESEFSGTGTGPAPLGVSALDPSIDVVGTAVGASLLLPYVRTTRAAVKAIVAPVNNRWVFCQEIDAWYQFVSASGATVNALTILAADDATSGRWVIRAREISVGGMLWADFAAMWAPAATAGITINMQGTWTCDSIQSMPSKLHLRMRQTVQILCTLTPSGSGSPERCPFYATAPAPTFTEPYPELTTATTIDSNEIEVDDVSQFSVGMEIALVYENLVEVFFVEAIDEMELTLTLDEAVTQPFPTGAVIVDCVSPKDIKLEFNGASVIGTFDAIVEFSKGRRCSASGLRGTAEAECPTLVNFDVGSQDCRFEDSILDGGGLAIGCWAFECGKRNHAEHITFTGAAEVGAFFTAGYGNYVSSCHGSECPEVYSINAAATGAGSQFLTINGSTSMGTGSSIGLNILNGGHQIKVSNFLAHHPDGTGVAVNGGSALSADVMLSNIDVSGSGTGLYVVEDCVGVTAVNVIANDCTQYGIICDGELRVFGFTSNNCVTAAAFCNLGGRLQVSGFDVSASFNGNWYAFNSNSTNGIDVSHGRIAMSGTGFKTAVANTAAGVADLSHIVSSGGSFGVLINAGGFRRGPGVDFSSASTPFDISGTGAELAVTIGPLESYTGTTKRLGVATSGAQIDVGAPAVVFGSTVVSPTIKQADDATNSATGDEMSLLAQTCTGTTSTGGSWRISSGGGTSQDGRGRLQVDGVTRYEIDHVGMGFFGVTPVARPAAYTQTYSTATRTHAAYTADDESVAYIGIDNAQGGTPYATVADLNALRVAVENLRVHHESTSAVLNQVIDDLQALGPLQ